MVTLCMIIDKDIKEAPYSVCGGDSPLTLLRKLPGYGNKKRDCYGFRSQIDMEINYILSKYPLNSEDGRPISEAAKKLKIENPVVLSTWMKPKKQKNKQLTGTYPLYAYNPKFDSQSRPIKLCKKESELDDSQISQMNTMAYVAIHLKKQKIPYFVMFVNDKTGEQAILDGFNPDLGIRYSDTYPQAPLIRLQIPICTV